MMMWLPKRVVSFISYNNTFDDLIRGVLNEEYDVDHVSVPVPVTPDGTRRDVIDFLYENMSNPERCIALRYAPNLMTYSVTGVSGYLGFYGKNGGYADLHPININSPMPAGMIHLDKVCAKRKWHVDLPLDRLIPKYFEDIELKHKMKRL